MDAAVPVLCLVIINSENLDLLSPAVLKPTNSIVNIIFCPGICWLLCEFLNRTPLAHVTCDGEAWFCAPPGSCCTVLDVVSSHWQHSQCSSLRFGGHRSSPNLKFSKLREIKQFKTVVHHSNTTWSRYLSKYVSR